MATGLFHALMMPMTPTGSWRTMPAGSRFGASAAGGALNDVANIGGGAMDFLARVADGFAEFDGDLPREFVRRCSRVVARWCSVFAAARASGVRRQ